MGGRTLVHRRMLKYKVLYIQTKLYFENYVYSNSKLLPILKYITPHAPTLYIERANH